MSDEEIGALVVTVADVRRWALAGGRAVGARGRIAKGLIAEFEAETGKIVMKQSGTGVLA